MVKHFKSTDSDCPLNPWTGAKEEGWYYRFEGEEDWQGPCPYGEAEARHKLANNLRSR